MDKKRKVKKVLFVNKFGPTSNAITGQTAKELADYLHEQGCEVCCLCMGAIYRANQKKTAVEVLYDVKFIRDYYHGDSAFIRLIMSFVDGFRLFFKSLFIPSDIIIVMTEPPLLFFWYQLFRKFIKRKLWYWTMDIYPNAFVAGKLITSNNIFYRLLKKVVYKQPPDLLIALGEEQCKFLQLQFKAALPYVVIPCGVVERKDSESALRANNDKIIFGYGGDMGAAHDPEFLIELIKQLNPEKHLMVLSLYGTKADYVKYSISGNSSIEYREFLNHNDIASFDINVASLLPEWNHISVPSKAVTAICCGSTLLLNAPESSDGWQMFRDACWLIEPAPSYKEQIKNFLEYISNDAITIKRYVARKLASQYVTRKHEAYEEILSYINNLKIQ